MKPLSLEETKLKEEMKERCLNKGQYVDENAKAKFDVLCHLEDFETQYWELKEKLKEITRLIRNIIDNDEEVDIYTLFDIQDIIKDKDDTKVQYEKYIKPYID